MSTTYPLHVEARLDAPLSRWRWAVKWFLAIPHYIVLAFLWIAFTVLTGVALIAILITGRYPRGIFDFNVGVLRWTWRVQYYTYGALGTDRYPPFTLGEAPDYPASLSVEYPAHLSRGLALVKWWLLAIPHYLIVGLLLGGGWFATRDQWFGGGLIALLVLIAGVILAATGRYPTQLFDFILGLNRWVLRVVGYAGLMTDEYPPFRLDAGGPDPGSTLTLPTPGPVQPSTPEPPPRPREWSAGRISAVVAGAFLLLVSIGLVAGGTAAAVADRFGRDDANYLTSDRTTLSTPTYALRTETVDLRGGRLPQRLFERVRIRATGQGAPVFVGVASEADVAAYLQGVETATVTDWSAALSTISAGTTAPSTRPAEQRFWKQSVAGEGTQTLEWPVSDGRWTVVAMNADASRSVSLTADIGVRAPNLGWIAVGLLAGGLVTLGAGLVITLTAARSQR